jgi:geranylgeranyl diphosphate synthase, type I
MPFETQGEWIANRTANLPTPHQDHTGELRCVQRLMQRLAHTDGTLGESAAYHLNTGGKFLRARLALSACAALDVDRKSAIYLAAACEFLHNASLVHDDIQDRDVQRREQESVWHRYGLNTAITLGDFFLVLGFQTLARIECSGRIRAALDRVFSERITDVIRGQTKDLEVTGEQRLSLPEYDELARAKTGPLLSLPIEGALILAGAGIGARDSAHNCLTWFGLAYQLRDDLLDFCAPDGRPAVASDLRNGRPNAVLLHFLADSRNGERHALSEFLSCSAERASADELDAWAARIRASNAFASAIDHFRACCMRSSHEADKLPRALAEVLKEFIAGIKHKIERLDARDLDGYRSECSCASPIA